MIEVKDLDPLVERDPVHAPIYLTPPEDLPLISLGDALILVIVASSLSGILWGIFYFLIWR